MKTLIKNTKKVFVWAAIFSFSFTAACPLFAATSSYSGENDRAIDDLSRRQEETFTYGSPYLVQSVLNEPQSADTQNNVDIHNMLEKALAVKQGPVQDDEGIKLKGPRGGGEAQVQATVETITILQDLSLPPTQEPPAIDKNLPKTVIDFLNGRKAVKYDAIFYKGRHAVVWDEKDKDGVHSVRMQSFDQEGQPLTGEVIIAIDDMLYKTIGLANGNVLVLWNKYDNYGSHDSYKMQIFDQGGQAVGPKQEFGRNASFRGMSAIDTLPDGNIYACWYESGGTLASAFTKFQVFDQYGEKKGTEYTLSGPRPVFDKVIALSNGKTAVFWQTNQCGTTNKLKVKLFDENGESFGQEYTIPWMAGNVTGNSSSVIAFSNGNIGIFASRAQDIITQMVDAAGDPIGNWRSITNEAYGVCLNVNLNNVVARPDGRVAVFWTVCSDGTAFPARTLKMKLLDSGGNAVTDEKTVFVDRKMAEYDLPDIKAVFLPNDTLTVTWREMADGGYPYSLYMQLCDLNGDRIVPAIRVSGNLYNYVYGLIPLRNGAMAVTWSESDSNYRVYLKIKIFDKDGAVVKLNDLGGEELDGDTITHAVSTWKTETIHEITINTTGNLNVTWSDGSSHNLNDYTMGQGTTPPPSDPTPPANPQPSLPQPDSHKSKNTFPALFRYDMFGSRPWIDSTTLKSALFNTADGNALASDLKDKGSALSINNMQPFNYAAYPNGLDYKVLQENLRDSLNASFSVRNLNIPIEAARSALEAMINTLEEKKDRTGIEETLLDASKAVMAESRYMDNQILQDFEQAVNTIMIAESMKDSFKGVDFAIVESALSSFVTDQNNIYNSYLKATEEAYKLLAEALGIDPDKDDLPSDYSLLYNLNTLAKRKILVDLSLQAIKEKDPSKRTEKEKLALNMEEKYNLSSLREEYRNKLGSMVRAFIDIIRSAIIDKTPSSLQKDGSRMEAIFSIDMTNPRP